VTDLCSKRAATHAVQRRVVDLPPYAWVNRPLGTTGSPHTCPTRIGPNNSYNDNKIRFPAPVPAGTRVRARAEIVSVDDAGGGWWQIVTRFTLEVEDSEKPCCVGDSVTRVMAPAAG
jgi:acyl-coenzyme A thioesterase PaaI-like protein